MIIDVKLSCCIPTGVAAAYKCAIACYEAGKYVQAATWCDNVSRCVEIRPSLLCRVKLCKAKAIAQLCLLKQNRCDLNGTNQWDLPGYNPRVERSKVGSEVLREVSFFEWEKLCSEALHAIYLLGEILDNDVLDEEGSRLLDLIMMTYIKEAGQSNKCRRCLLCRAFGDLVPLTFIAPLQSKSSSENDNDDLALDELYVSCFQSFLYISSSWSLFMFCKECNAILSNYPGSDEKIFLELSDLVMKQPTEYGKDAYCRLLTFITCALPLTVTGYISNWDRVHTLFLACRQYLLSPEKPSFGADLPRMFLFKHSESIDDVFVGAITSCQQKVSIGGDPYECDFFQLFFGDWVLLLDFQSGAEYFPSHCIIHPQGGTYTPVAYQDMWGVLPFCTLEVFRNVAETVKHMDSFQSIMMIEGLAAELDEFETCSSAKIPHCKKILSFLPNQFRIKTDSDNIIDISPPYGHIVLGHYYDPDKDWTFLLLCASESELHKGQLYFIFTCKLWGYNIVEAGDVKTATVTLDPSPKTSFNGTANKAVNIVRQLLIEKISHSSYLESCMRKIFIKYGSFEYNSVSLYRNITR